jgi:hypothetical protein
MFRVVARFMINLQTMYHVEYVDTFVTYLRNKFQMQSSVGSLATATNWKQRKSSHGRHVASLYSTEVH